MVFHHDDKVAVRAAADLGDADVVAHRCDILALEAQEVVPVVEGVHVFGIECEGYEGWLCLRGEQKNGVSEVNGKKWREGGRGG